MKILAFCRDNVWVMKKYRLGIHGDKIWADKYYPKYPKIPHNLFGRSAQSAKIFWIFEKKLSLGVRSPWQYTFNTNGILLFLAPQNDG